MDTTITDALTLDALCELEDIYGLLDEDEKITAIAPCWVVAQAILDSRHCRASLSQYIHLNSGLQVEAQELKNHIETMTREYHELQAENIVLDQRKNSAEGEKILSELMNKIARLEDDKKSLLSINESLLESITEP